MIHPLKSLVIIMAIACVSVPIYSYTVSWGNFIISIPLVIGLVTATVLVYWAYTVTISLDLDKETGGKE